VLHKLNSAVKTDSENTHGGSSMTTLNYIGLDGFTRKRSATA
jgi:hypothetical protein